MGPCDGKFALAVVYELSRTMDVDAYLGVPCSTCKSDELITAMDQWWSPWITQTEQNGDAHVIGLHQPTRLILHCSGSVSRLAVGLLERPVLLLLLSRSAARRQGSVQHARANDEPVQQHGLRARTAFRKLLGKQLPLLITSHTWPKRIRPIIITHDIWFFCARVQSHDVYFEADCDVHSRPYKRWWRSAYIKRTLLAWICLWFHWRLWSSTHTPILFYFIS